MLTLTQLREQQQVHLVLELANIVNEAALRAVVMEENLQHRLI